MNKSNIRWGLTLFSLVALCLVSWTGYGQKHNPSRVTWEYEIIIIHHSEGSKATDILNAQGAMGWEVVQGRFPDSSGGDLAFILKRAK